MRPRFIRCGIRIENTLPAVRFAGIAKASHAAVATSIGVPGTPSRKNASTAAKSATSVNVPA